MTANGTYTLRIKNTSTNGADYATKEGAAGTAPQLVVTTRLIRLDGQNSVGTCRNGRSGST